MMKRTKAWVLGMLVLAFALLVSACGSDGNGDEPKKIGISMANSSASWQRNGQNIKEGLEAKGFATDLQFADSAEQQAEQIRAIMEKGAQCIVIGAVDSGALVDVLKEAKEKHIPVIAYDRLIMDTDAVSYYASYDPSAVGEAMGKYIEAKLELKTTEDEPFNMEIFAGDPADNNARVFYDSAMKVLQPYIASGHLVVPSGQTSFEATAIKGWSQAGAESRMNQLLQAHYADMEELNIVLAPNDGLARGIIKSLEANYEEEWPIISGQDADRESLEAIRADKQTFTVYKDPAQLNTKCIKLVKAVVDGSQPEINDVTSFNNGAIVVPAYVCTPLVIDKNNLNDVKKE